MNILPLGSVVTLKNAKKIRKLMIVLRNPVFSKENIIGYTDYGACIYPLGVNSLNSFHYFNHEHIKDILFAGYIDDMEIKYQDLYINHNITYPKFKF